MFDFIVYNCIPFTTWLPGNPGHHNNAEGEYNTVHCPVWKHLGSPLLAVERILDESWQTGIILPGSELQENSSHHGDQAAPGVAEWNIDSTEESRQQHKHTDVVRDLVKTQDMIHRDSHPCRCYSSQHHCMSHRPGHFTVRRLQQIRR